MLTEFNIKQGDTLEPIVGTLRKEDGTIITRSLTDADVRFHMRAADGTLLLDVAAIVVDATAKTVGYQWIAGDTDVSSAGTQPHQAEFEVTYADGNIETFPNTSNINIHIPAQVA